MTRKYRQWVAAILLVVYAFVATPVQLWHHHPAKSNAPNAKFTGKSFVEGYQFNSSTGIVSDDCPVCAHKYSSYTDYKYIPEIAAAVFCADTRPDFCTPILLVPSFHFSNKSPPVRA